MNLFDLENELETLARGCDCDCKSHPVDPIPQFQLEPLPWFCIDHPNVGDCIVFEVSAEMRPRGNQMILCTPALVNASLNTTSRVCENKGAFFVHLFHQEVGGFY